MHCLPLVFPNFIFKKLIYREYEAGFKTAKPAPELSGILGPTLHAEVGDTLRIHFNNMANKPLTIHPQGIKYGKTSEGSDYADSTFNLEKMDDAVLPGQTYTYNWDIPESVGPKDADPFCLTYIYYSHENMVQDFNSGLVGTLLICKNGSLNDNGLQKFFKKEFILMFAVFDESQSSLTASPKDDGMLMYTVNGYVNGTMPVFEACVGDTISWHIIGMSSKPELFSVHFFGQSLEQNRHRMSVIGLVGSSSTTANMTVNQIGKWLISSLNHKHLQAGMHCYIDVKLCGDKSASIRRLSLFQKRYIKVWEHFIAAEEVMWDYNHGSKDKLSYTQKYKKVIYKEYTDKTFTKRVPPASDSLLGPIIRAQVKDTITVVFKNMASKPYSIYPHGVSIHKDHEGATYPPNLKGAETQDQAVMPGDIRTYQWTVLDTDEPTRNDSQCLSRMYHSAVNIHRDIASGLIGPLLICKSMSLNTRGYQEKADEEQVAMFTVFDENQSWYREENLKGLQKDSRTQPSEYNANVIQTINGNSILNTILGFCHSHIVQWHVASVGFVDEILSVHITGHLFRYRKRREDVINLFPMSSESVTVEMDNQGIWLFGTYGVSKKNKDLKIRFRDAICIAEQDYNYDDDVVANSIENVHPPATGNLQPIDRRNAEEVKDYDEIDTEDNIDTKVNNDYSDLLAEMFKIRSLRNNTDAKAEELNLTALAIEDMHESTLTENITASRSPTVLKENESNSSYDLSGEEKYSLDGQKNTSSEIDAEISLTGSDNASATNINRGVNKTMLMNDKTFELNTTETVEEKREWFNNVKENGNNTFVMKVASDTSEGTENPDFIYEDDYNDLGVFTDRPIMENKSIEDKTQSAMVVANNLEETETKSVVKRHILNTRENATFNEIDIPDVPTDENEFHSTTSKNINSDEILPPIPENVPPILKSPNDATDFPSETSERHILNTRENATFNENDNPDVPTDEHDFHSTTSKNINSDDILPPVPENVPPIIKSPNDATDFPSETTESKSNDVTEEYDSGDLTTSSISPSDFGNLMKKESIHSTSTNSFFENLQITTAPTYNGFATTPGHTMDEYVDEEFREMFGDHILEDVMQAIFFKPDANDTDTDAEGHHLTFPEEKDHDNITRLHNDSLALPVNGNSHEEPLKIQEDMTVDQTVQVAKIRNNTMTKKIRSVQRQKGVGKIPGQRTGFYRYYAIKNDSSETQNLIEVNENFQANISIRSGSGKPGLSPRGLKPEIIIGVPRDNDEGYNEYDYDSMNEDDNTPNFQYIKFEDPYKVTTDDDMNSFSNPDMIIERYLRSAKGKMRNYFIAAEEIQWDYTGMQKSWSNVHESAKSQLRGTQFTKVIYRQYTDGTFQRPELQGEYEEHLGILGPVIRAEVEDVIQVTFKNFASRAYSIHAHGVSYEKSSEGWSYEDESHEWLKKDDLVKPGESHVYVWYAKKQSGPEPEGFDCRAWVYYSAVNPERDIHSGLIGPLLICRNGTLDKNNRPLGVREFTLLFMTFEEEKSWYSEKIVRKPCTEMTAKPSSSMKCYNFHAINGIMYNLQGLQMYEGEKVRWHLLNMGGPKDTHVVHFHGQTFIENTNKESQHGIYPLLPGSFATIEMVPSKVGRWLLDTEVAEYQQAGMQAIFQITDAECNLPLGMEAGSISDHQITAAHHIDYWEPRLARLNYAGSYNAWSAEMNKTSLPWIQVDLEKQLLITGIKTQGASKYFTSFYTKEFFIVYSKDRKKWSTFKGNTIGLQKLFQGNTDSSTITENEIEPPISARYIRVYPTKYSNKPTIRMELLGCEIQGCFKPLGMENNLITDEQITASSYKTSWYRTWKPSLARLNKQGMVNAWQAKSNNNQQWLQIDFLQTKKLTGIATQGVKSFTTEMYVTGYTVFYSENGNDWNAYTDPSTKMEKIFKGNSNNYGHVRNQFKTPIFSRFLKIIPKTWSENIAMRIEIYGCDL
uniref:Coagulation factor V n=1 Tax=Leptobrachium leishanense TaxID=445787 RepID=A0A8C5LQ13_9ANUR